MKDLNQKTCTENTELKKHQMLSKSVDEQLMLMLVENKTFQKLKTTTLTNVVKSMNISKYVDVYQFLLIGSVDNCKNQILKGGNKLSVAREYIIT